MTIVQTDRAPAAIGPYSQAIVCNGLVFTSGQIPCAPETGAVVGTTITVQTEQVLKNLTALLEAAGSGLDAVLKTTCFLADMADFAAFNQMYGQHFTHRPARSCVAAKTLPKNVLVEIEAVAKIKEGPHGSTDV
ncbi:MAG: RidA family protein [Oscillospiraceae bacterium]|nr:RidA family protein [Oscillospiraceae bacterium]